MFWGETDRWRRTVQSRDDNLRARHVLDRFGQAVEESKRFQERQTSKIVSFEESIIAVMSDSR